MTDLADLDFDCNVCEADCDGSNRLPTCDTESPDAPPQDYPYYP